jgi:hypothetical protein
MRTIVHMLTINLLTKDPTSEQGNPYTYRRSHAPTHSPDTLAASLLAGVHVRGCPIFSRLFIKPHGSPYRSKPMDRASTSTQMVLAEDKSIREDLAITHRWTGESTWTYPRYTHCKKLVWMSIAQATGTRCETCFED